MALGPGGTPEWRSTKYLSTFVGSFFEMVILLDHLGKKVMYSTRWWFQISFIFTLKIGEDSHFDSYFSDGLVQPPTRVVYLGGFCTVPG